MQTMRRKLLNELKAIIKSADDAGETDFAFDLDEVLGHYERLWKRKAGKP